MHSRAILLLTLFSFGCLLVIGSIALQLTSASAQGPVGLTRSIADQKKKKDKEPSSTLPKTAPDSTERPLSAMERALAGSLDLLMKRTYDQFEYGDAGVSDAMIPYLAEIISTVNQNEELVFRIEISEPDAALARRRAQTLNDVLRLNVLNPSKLRIVGNQGPHLARVYVSVE
jgi:hypothetical protein